MNTYTRPHWLLLLLLCLPISWSFAPPHRVAPDSAPQAARNIILMIGDGMGLTQITAGLIANGNKLALERFANIGLMRTFSADDLITDSAAGATAFACGEKTNNGRIAMSPSLRKMPTILEIAHERGLLTGVVATSYLQHATPASFYAHCPDRNRYEDISLDLLQGYVDYGAGGGRRFLHDRHDERDMIAELKAEGYQVFDKLRTAKRKAKPGKLLVFAEEGHLPPMSEGRGRYLRNAVKLGVGRLSDHENGFFMVVEGSQIDWGGHTNDKSYIISELLDFDRTIDEVLDFAEADGNTLVIVTADHETGGFAIEGGSLFNRDVHGDFTTGGHTGTLVPVFAYGPGAHLFRGWYDNTAIFEKMMQAMAWEN